MEYPVKCQRCIHAFSIETRSFEIAYPLDYENRIKKFLSDNCRKCGETINRSLMAARSRKHEAELLREINTR